MRGHAGPCWAQWCHHAAMFTTQQRRLSSSGKASSSIRLLCFRRQQKPLPFSPPIFIADYAFFGRFGFRVSFLPRYLNLPKLPRTRALLFPSVLWFRPNRLWPEFLQAELWYKKNRKQTATQSFAMVPEAREAELVVGTRPPLPPPSTFSSQPSSQICMGLPSLSGSNYDSLMLGLHRT